MSEDQQHPYDSALKSLMGDEIAEILPNLLPESEYIDEQNIEIDRTTLKADLVYNIRIPLCTVQDYCETVNDTVTARQTSY